MKLHRFYLLVGGQRVRLPANIDSVALAQEQAERTAKRIGTSVPFYSETLLGVAGGESRADRESAVARQE